MTRQRFRIKLHLASQPPPPLLNRAFVFNFSEFLGANTSKLKNFLPIFHLWHDFQFTFMIKPQPKPQFFLQWRILILSLHLSRQGSTSISNRIPNALLKSTQFSDQLNGHRTLPTSAQSKMMTTISNPLLGFPTHLLL